MGSCCKHKTTQFHTKNTLVCVQTLFLRLVCTNQQRDIKQGMSVELKESLCARDCTSIIIIPIGDHGVVWCEMG